MIRTRVALALLAAVVAASSVSAGIFNRKARLDAARVKALVETLRADPDERKRKAAAAELRDADPRTHADIIPTLLHALRHDLSAATRAESADSLRHYKVVFPVAGMALEAAAEGDPNSQVRDAAQQALWEYHLGGYRSAKGADGFAGQTAEPPLARPGVRASGATASVIVQAGGSKVVEAVTVSHPRLVVPPVPPVPAAVVIPTKVSAAPPAVFNVTPEPPFAPPAGRRSLTLPISIPVAPSK